MQNAPDTPVETIVDQLNEMRPLPMGRQEFEAWSDRIIAGACIPGDGSEAHIESLKGALAVMVLKLGPTESHKPDAHFIHGLRKGAANEVANAIFVELKKKRQDAALAEAKDAQAAATE